MLRAVLGALPPGCTIPILTSNFTEREFKSDNLKNIPIVSFDRHFLQKQCRTLGRMVAQGIGNIFDGEMPRDNICIKGYKLPTPKG